MDFRERPASLGSKDFDAGLTKLKSKDKLAARFFTLLGSLERRGLKVWGGRVGVESLEGDLAKVRVDLMGVDLVMERAGLLVEGANILLVEGSNILLVEGECLGVEEADLVVMGAELVEGAGSGVEGAEL